MQNANLKWPAKFMASSTNHGAHLNVMHTLSALRTNK
jgi:hypothetical protein